MGIDGRKGGSHGGTEKPGVLWLAAELDPCPGGGGRGGSQYGKYNEPSEVLIKDCWLAMNPSLAHEYGWKVQGWKKLQAGSQLAGGLKRPLPWSGVPSAPEKALIEN